MQCSAQHQAVRHHTISTDGAARHAGCSGPTRPCVTARRRRQGSVGQVRECTGPAMPQHTYAQRAHNTHSPARLPVPVGRHPGLLAFGNSAFGTPHASATPAMHCLTALGQQAVPLLQCTASLPGGSGQCNSCNALPHCPRAAGRATPATHCLTAWGQWAVELLQRSAPLPGVVWCGKVWCGVVWCGVVWCGVVWCGVVWCGVVWCGVVWCGVVWCGVVWCGVVWCGVLWCDALCCVVLYPIVFCCVVLRCVVLCCAVLCCVVLCCVVLCCVVLCCVVLCCVVLWCEVLCGGPGRDGD